MTLDFSTHYSSLDERLQLVCEDERLQSVCEDERRFLLLTSGGGANYPANEWDKVKRIPRAQELTRWRERVDDAPPRCLRGG